MEMDDILQGLAKGIFPNLSFDKPMKEEATKHVVIDGPLPLPVLTNSSAPKPMPGQTFGGFTGSAQPPPIPFMEPPAPEGVGPTPMPAPPTGDSMRQEAAGAGQPQPDRTNEYLAAWQPFEPMWKAEYGYSQDVGPTAFPPDLSHNSGPGFITSAEPGHGEGMTTSSIDDDKGLGNKLGKLTTAIDDLIRSLDANSRDRERQRPESAPGPQPGGGFIPSTQAVAAGESQNIQLRGHRPLNAASGVHWSTAISRALAGR